MRWPRRPGKFKLEKEAEMDGTMEEQREGRTARAIERQTSRIPSDMFLWTGVGAIAASLTLALLGRKNAANFVGQWVPTVLLLGVYNKIVKVAGHDVDRAAAALGSGLLPGLHWSRQGASMSAPRGAPRNKSASLRTVARRPRSNE